VLKSVRRFVYILRSVNTPERRYLGLASDIASRVRAHNAGQNPSTARWKPWVVDVCSEFRTEQIALRFEKPSQSAEAVDNFRWAMSAGGEIAGLDNDSGSDLLQVRQNRFESGQIA
jgi:putative endonuclease